jgi:hypothetical protein
MFGLLDAAAKSYDASAAPVDARKDRLSIMSGFRKFVKEEHTLFHSSPNKGVCYVCIDVDDL